MKQAINSQLWVISKSLVFVSILAFSSILFLCVQYHFLKKISHIVPFFNIWILRHFRSSLLTPRSWKEMIEWNFECSVGGMLKGVQQCGSNLSGENFECSVGRVLKGVQPCESDLLGVLSHATWQKYWPKNLSTLRLQREFGLSFWRTFVLKFLFQRLWLLWGCKENLVGVFDLFLC